MRTSNFVAAAVLGMGASICLGADKPRVHSLQIVRQGAILSIADGDRLLLQYQCTPNPRKSYVKQLCSPAGVNVLRDSPHDHKHHHALMFAVGVDGVDFWAV